MRKILKTLFGLVLLLVLVAGGFALGVYLRLFDTQELNEEYALHELPIVGEYFVPPTEKETTTAASAPSSTAAAAPAAAPMQLRERLQRR